MRKLHPRNYPLYHALVMIPDRIYPFRVQVEGQWVRGLRAYNATLARYQRKYGAGHYGYKLMTYRQICHLIGAWLFLVIAAFISQSLLESAKALYAFLVTALLFFTWQEFYLHRHMYRQIFKKSVLDWMSWCVPIGGYLLLQIA